MLHISGGELDWNGANLEGAKPLSFSGAMKCF